MKCERCNKEKATLYARLPTTTIEKLDDLSNYDSFCLPNEDDYDPFYYCARCLKKDLRAAIKAVGK